MESLEYSCLVEFPGTWPICSLLGDNPVAYSWHRECFILLFTAHLKKIIGSKYCVQQIKGDGISLLNATGSNIFTC